jgi:ADP-heptose:LPS heptosyltransferase
MGSLGKFYRNSIEEFPLQENYLKYDEVLSFELAKKYKFDKSKELVGISWKSKNPRNGLKRGVELIDFVKKLDNGNRIFLNLQYGEVDEEIDILYQETGIKMINIKEIDNFKNLDGLAALIAMCDEVVSIDNSTVHLSGALGKKTSVLLQQSPDWRWLQGLEFSPWYSSVKLIRGAIS